MTILDKTMGLIAPHYCVGCGNVGSVLCKECAFSTMQLPSLCYICAKASKAYTPCSVHFSKQKPQHIYVSLEYNGLAKRLIHAYKFDCKRAGAKDIAFVMDLWTPFLDPNYTYTWVPTLPKHVRQRGFDHTKLLAKEFAKIRGLKANPILERVKSTTQIGSNRAKRKTQLADAFKIKVNKNVKNKHVVLIDDVVTTGATIEACSKILYSSGAKSVDVVAFARTP